MDGIKEIPYGVASFVEVMEQNQYYVDKTQFIPLLEQQPRNLLLVRPRRFGKSLLLNMLRAYYDLSMTDRFRQLFGTLWIGSRPTPLQGKYQVLYLDFSRVGSIEGLLPKDFDVYCSGALDDFAENYKQHYYPGFSEEMKAEEGATAKLNFLDRKARRYGCRLYLIIDEYDNFTNVVLNEQGEEIYHALTHASGFYREVFKKFKGMFERIFMTGVSPVTLDDLSSGFNIGWNISTSPKFNALLGFSETDVREMFRYYQGAGLLEGDIEEMITEMKPWYDNYCFAEECLDDPKIFNCDMVLYYMRNRIDTGKSPKFMIDPNTRTDYEKMKKLIRMDRLDGDRKGVLHRIAEEGRIMAQLLPTFPAKDLVKPNVFTSLLFYYGMLTIDGTLGEYQIMVIPNNNVRKQYYEYILEDYQTERPIDLSALGLLFLQMAYKGDWREALQFIADAYRDHSSVRSAIEGERNIQGFFTAYLSVNAYYLTAPEVELNHGFCDMFLMPDLQRYKGVEHSYILELKYLPAKDFEARSEAQWTEAVGQMKRYRTGDRVRQLCQGTQLHGIILQFRGWDLARMEEVDV